MEEGELATEDSAFDNSLHKSDQNEQLDIENGEECSADSEDNEFEEEFLYLLRVNELEEAVELIKSKKVKNLNYRNEDGNTALHFVMANNLEVATHFLLKILRVNYNVCNNSGNSPLVWAVQNKALEAVRVLLLHDYEVNLNFIKNNLKERSKYFEKEEIESYLNYNPKCLKGTKGLEIGKFDLSDDLIEFYKINDSFNPENKINILHKNSFGKSLLNEVFNCSNLELLQLVLEHPISHSLDRSDPNNYNSFTNNDDNSDSEVDNNELNKKNEKEECVVHTFQFMSSTDSTTLNSSTTTIDNNLDYNVRIKEVSVCNGDVLNSKESELDRSGMMIWESSIMCSFWLFDLLKRNAIYTLDPDHILNNNHNQQMLNIHNNELLSNNNNFNQLLLNGNKEEDDLGSVIELGSGCGLVGISFYKFCQILNKKVKKVVLSDLASNTLDNLSYNIDINCNNSNSEDNNNNNNNNKDGLELMKLDWKNFDFLDKFQVVIGSDLIYDSSLVGPLMDTINRLLDEKGVFLYCFKLQRNGSNEFITELLKNDYLVELRQVPREYQRNPLMGKSEEYCLSFFPDLESDDYFLLKAVKSPNV